jgi:L-cysteine:1D-myo-inositol 2-amino-2-deoxy-alpha-D-glucopyranoside ligase
MVGLHGTKMSKSLGNLVFVGDLLQEWEPAAIRLALLEHHYRNDWEWESSGLERAARRLDRWRSAGEGDGAGEGGSAGEGDGGLEEVRRHLDDDLDAPGALAALDELAAKDIGITPGAALLGVTL